MKGKIVGMMRGPSPPATFASFSLKLYYAQEAGAVAVIFFDSDPTGDLFSNLPSIDEGPITFGLPPIPEGIQLKVRIPAVIMTHRCVTGAFETDIQATIYEMRYKVNLGQAEFQASSNPTWNPRVAPYITEIGLYDNEKNLMIISKLQSPVLRQGVQQFLIKFDI